MAGEVNTHNLKAGDTVVLRAAPGTSYLVNLVIADGTNIEVTITGNNPCTVICGQLGMNINVNDPPPIGIDIEHISHGNIHNK
ncbi:hypothetical protein AB6Q56_04465 [Dechloromonas sp. ARDL1]|uniref:hypothetical protein n=1 Tax=Dechloromonas sp. ARDL1 TaxID=3322121 RepID=UPI003DA6ED67